jgi:quinol monooxygenase YgiN
VSHETENINLVATFRAAEGKTEAVRELIVEYGHIVRNEPGNIFFHVYTDADDDAEFVIIERYVDQAAFDAHLGAEVGKEFNRNLGPLIEGDGSQLQFLTHHS